MTISILAFRHLLPISLVLSFFAGLLPSITPAIPVRIEGLGVEMSALPVLTAENTDSTITHIKNTGAMYIRQEVNWSTIETSPDVYDWSATLPLDQLFSAADGQDLHIVATLTGGPVYLVDAEGRVEQEAFIERWERFVNAVVGHFGEQVDIWEIGSQLNSSHAMSPFLLPLEPFNSTAPDPVFYSRILKTAAKVINEGDPNDELWLGSLTGLAAADCAMSPLTFLLELHAARGWRYADAILYEPRHGSAAPEFAASGVVNSACASNLMVTPSSLSQEVQAVQELARQLGGKRVLVSGLGWQGNDLAALSNTRGISAGQVEADMLVRATAALMAKDAVPVVFWHTNILQNPSAYQSMTNLVKILTTTVPMGEQQAGEVFEYRFREGGRNILLAWRVVGGDEPATAAFEVGDIPSLTAWAADSPGTSEASGQKIPANNAGQVIVLLNERPVIFSGRSGDLAGSVRQAVHDQAELWGIELRRAALRGLNEARGQLGDLLEKWLDEAKESALDWGEGKIDELLP